MNVCSKPNYKQRKDVARKMLMKLTRGVNFTKLLQAIVPSVFASKNTNKHKPTVHNSGASILCTKKVLIKCW